MNYPEPGEYFHPQSESEREQVQALLREILASPGFNKSKRYAAVLEFLVVETLLGRGDQLKERTIGIEVFRRRPEYDTASDHVVRSAMAEVRKRLARYHQHEEAKSLKIEVSPGCYKPQFKRASGVPREPYLAPLPDIHEPVPTRSSIQLPSEPVLSAAQPAGNGGQRGWLSRWPSAAGVFLILLIGIDLWQAHRLSNDPYSTFWKPILTSDVPVLVCIGDMQGGRQALDGAPASNPGKTLLDFQNSPPELVNVDDAITVAKFSGLMQANGRQFQVKSESDATFTDFQNGPAIIVGLLNNNWSERLIPKLPFSVDHPSASKVTIRERNKPSGQGWSEDYAMPYFDVNRDYALVVRMRDPETDQLIVVAAGITIFGTTAAGEFLTDRNEINKLAAIAPPGWEKKNMEIVLSTDVIRGRSGPATVVAARFW